MAARKPRNSITPTPTPAPDGRVLESDPAERLDHGLAEAPLDSNEVAAEAYSLYVARGSQDGDDLGDWLAAEQIVRERHRGNRRAE